MALKHNKKRNAGMLSEFFAMYIADSMVSRNPGKVSMAKKLWNKHVCTGTELQKEMHLFGAIQDKTFENKQVAYDLLAKVKRAATGLKKEKLDREKTVLIREINRVLGESFFDKEIKNYTELASIQILMNYCSGTNFLKEGVINPAMAELEDKILGSMMINKQQPDTGATRSLQELLSGAESDVDGLVVNIMQEKMNKKFTPILTEDQKTILEQFVFETNGYGSLKETLVVLRDETIGLITEELTTSKPPETERKRLQEINGLLREDYHDVSDIDDTMITFYMTVSKLNDELKDN